MSSFYADNSRIRPQANPDQYLDLGYSSYGLKESRTEDLNGFGELPSNAPSASSIHRSSMDQFFNKTSYSVEEPQPDFESAHFRATHMKFHHMANEPLEDHDSTSSFRNSNVSLLGELGDDLPVLNRYDSNDEQADFFEHHEPARRVHSLPDVERGSLILHTRSVDAISREQQYMVRQAVREPSPQPLAFQGNNAPRNNLGGQRPGSYQQQQYSPTSQQAYPQPQQQMPQYGAYGIAEPQVDPRNFTPSYTKKPSAYNNAAALNASNSTLSTPPVYAEPRQSYGATRAPSAGAQTSSQYSSFVQRLPSMLNQPSNGGNASAAPYYVSPLESSAAAAAAAGMYSTHQQIQQSRGGITTSNGGFLNLTASRGQLLIGSNQGRGVYSERSSSNLIMAGLYEGTGSVYVVSLV